MVDNVGRLILRLANTSFLSTDIKKRSKSSESQRSKVHESFYFTAISYLQPEEFKISCPDFFPALRRSYCTGLYGNISDFEDFFLDLIFTPKPNFLDCIQ